MRTLCKLGVLSGKKYRDHKKYDHVLAEYIYLEIGHKKPRRYEDRGYVTVMKRKRILDVGFHKDRV